MALFVRPVASAPHACCVRADVTLRAGANAYGANVLATLASLLVCWVQHAGSKRLSVDALFTLSVDATDVPVTPISVSELDAVKSSWSPVCDLLSSDSITVSELLARRWYTRPFARRTVFGLIVEDEALRADAATITQLLKTALMCSGRTVVTIPHECHVRTLSFLLLSLAS